MSDQPPAENAARPLRFEQKRFSNRTTFELDDEGLRYTVADRAGSRTFSTSYGDLSRDHNTLVERNDWLGNVGLLWLAIGAVLTGLAAMGGAWRPSVWLWIGAACYVAYRVRVTEYTVIPSQKGNVLVIKTDGAARILGELERRRAEQLREWYDFFDANEDPEQARGRYRFLHREQVLSDEDLAQRLARLEHVVEAPQTQLEAQKLN